jgi:hypothetical protein
MTGWPASVVGVWDMVDIPEYIPLPGIEPALRGIRRKECISEISG